MSGIQSLFFAIVWLVMLIFIAWPVAGLAAGIWILLQPLEALRTDVGADARYRQRTPIAVFGFVQLPRWRIGRE